jgi:hypothetical protein
MGVGDRVIGYIRVSTTEQGTNGAGLDAQRAAIEAECDRMTWQLIRIEEDVLSGRTLRRPGLQRVLEACRCARPRGGPLDAERRVPRQHHGLRGSNGSGRPPTVRPQLARRIRSLRTRGHTLQAISDRLNGEGVPTPRGGAIWRPSSLRAVLAER